MSKLSVNELTDETGSGAPSFPNGVSVTGAALTDPEITGGIFLGGTGSANYLDDYEEGTWTPVWTTTGTDFSQSQSSSSSIYTKVGNVVTAKFGISFSGAVSGGTGDVVITGLPFTASTGSYSGGLRFGRITLTSDDYFARLNGTEVKINYQNSGGNSIAMPASNVNGNTSPFIQGIVTYFTNS